MGNIIRFCSWRLIRFCSWRLIRLHTVRLSHVVLSHNIVRIGYGTEHCKQFGVRADADLLDI